MTQEELEGNKLIAEFMGKQVYSGIAEMEAVPIEQLKPYYFEYDLKYHTSWDWLMPVVEKIETINIGERNLIGVSIRLNSCTIATGTQVYAKEHLDTKIHATWKALVEFIKWYNKSITSNQNETN